MLHKTSSYLLGSVILELLKYLSAPWKSLSPWDRQASFHWEAEFSKFHEQQKFWKHFLGFKRKYLKKENSPFYHEMETMFSPTHRRKPCNQINSPEAFKCLFSAKTCWNQEPKSRQPRLEMNFHKMKFKFHSQSCFKQWASKFSSLANLRNYLGGKGRQKFTKI